MKHLRLYATQDGESHVEEVHVKFDMAVYAPPAPEFGVSETGVATSHVMVRFPENWDSDFHPTPRRQIIVILSGRLEGKASDGTNIDLLPGDVVLMEDTTGKGHTARAMEGNEVLALMIHLD